MKKTVNSSSFHRSVTHRNLIAADIDKTLLDHEKGYEKEKFFLHVGPRLIVAATLGANLAVLTGNSMRELCNRFLRYLISEMCHAGQLRTLEKFHFLCNSGGVYAHFPADDPILSKIIGNQVAFQNKPEQVFRELVKDADNSSKIAIRPRFIHPDFIGRNIIPRQDVRDITGMLEPVMARYRKELEKNKERLSARYDLKKVMESGTFNFPKAEKREVEYGQENDVQKEVVQITVKPVLSFRHAFNESKLFSRDLRTKYTGIIQKRLDENGFTHYIAKPGGRSSIDITLEKLDKASALEFLINYLNVQGTHRLGGSLGSNTVYIGDEVIVGGGNDYPVTRIPGLLVLAVNEDNDLVPFLHRVFVPFCDLSGPDATVEVLSKYNHIAKKMFKNGSGAANGRRTALDNLKEDMFMQRIRDKMNRLHVSNVDDLQMIHAFVTLMCRKDPGAQKWLSLLAYELDAIMTRISNNAEAYQPALGTSHDDW